MALFSCFYQQMTEVSGFGSEDGLGHITNKSLKSEACALSQSSLNASLGDSDDSLDAYSERLLDDALEASVSNSDLSQRLTGRDTSDAEESCRGTSPARADESPWRKTVTCRRCQQLWKRNVPLPRDASPRSTSTAGDARSSSTSPARDASSCSTCSAEDTSSCSTCSAGDTSSCSTCSAEDTSSCSTSPAGDASPRSTSSSAGDASPRSTAPAGDASSRSTSPAGDASSRSTSPAGDASPRSTSSSAGDASYRSTSPVGDTSSLQHVLCQRR